MNELCGALLDDPDLLEFNGGAASCKRPRGHDGAHEGDGLRWGSREQLDAARKAEAESP